MPGLSLIMSTITPGSAGGKCAAPDDSSTAGAPGQLSGGADVRLRPDWQTGHTDRYQRATHPDHKTP